MSQSDEPLVTAGAAAHSGDPGPTAEATPQMPFDPMAVTGGRRWVIPAVMMTILIGLFYIFAWWLQDVVAPFINEGEADISTEQADARATLSDVAKPRQRIVRDQRIGVQKQQPRRNAQFNTAIACRSKTGIAAH